MELLRKAWNDPSVTFETAQRPTVKQIWTSDFLVDSQQVADHNRFASEGQAETVLSLAKTMREATKGNALIGTYYAKRIVWKSTTAFFPSWSAAT